MNPIPITSLTYPAPPAYTCFKCRQEVTKAYTLPKMVNLETGAELPMSQKVVCPDCFEKVMGNFRKARVFES